MATGFPAIPTPNRIDLRAIQAAIQGARQRIEALEAQLGIVSSTAQQTSSTSTSNLNSILTQLSNLTKRVIALEQAATTDIGQFVAGESLVIGQGVVPITSTTIGAVDPSDPTRIFGLIGIALNSATPGTAVQVQRRGVLTLPGVSGLIAGRAVYVDGVGVTQTPDYDATAIPLGVAVSTTQIFISPDWPALLYQTFSSGFVDRYLDYLPVTFRALQSLSSLEALIDALPYNSGAASGMMVPVTQGGIAVRVTAGDIARLAGGTADLEALIDALAYNSGADSGMMVPVTIGGVAVRVTAGDIARLGTLLSLVSVLPFSSGAESGMLVPVEYNGVMVLVTAGDIARLGGGTANLQTLIDALAYNSGAERSMMVPVTIGGIAVRVEAGDIARLGSANVTVKSWLQLAAAPETGAAAVASAIVTDRMPFDIQNLEVKASLTAAQATGSLLTVDIKVNGTSIFSTLLTFDNTSTTTVGAATPAVITATTIFADDVITIDVTQVGDGTAQGLKVTIGGTLTGASGFFGVINGLNGKTVLTGTIAPTSGVGNDGDSYYDYVHFKIYSPKASGAWPSGVSLIGPTGPTNVTSVDVSVTAATILSITGNPVTSSSGGGSGAGTLTFGYSGTALPVANGGTGFTSYTIGDLLQASASNTLATRAAVATGNALISGGVGTVSSWGKIGLTTHISGTLAIANGGTGLTSTTANFIFVGPVGSTGAPTWRKSVPADLNDATVVLTDATTVAWAMGVSSSFSLTLTTSRILGAPTGMADGQRCILRIKQSATGTCVITWPSIFKWAGGVAGVLSITANAIDELEVRYQAAQNTFFATLTKAYA